MTPVTFDPEQVVTPAQVRLVVGPAAPAMPTLKTMRREGRGPAWVRLGERRVGYVVADLRAWVAANRTDPAAQ